MVSAHVAEDNCGFAAVGHLQSGPAAAAPGGALY
jgi:hypothetical protein